jgi:hypothetical protein
MGLLFMQNARIQNWLTQYVSVKIAEKLHSRISLENASFSFINRIRLKNICIQDQHGDTLLFAEKIVGILSDFNWSTKEVTISSILMDDAYINFASDTSGILNLKFIIDAISTPGKKGTSKSDLQFKKIDLNNSRFHYRNEAKNRITTGINYSDLDLRNLNFRLENLSIIGGIISFKLNKMNFKEKSGFIIEEMNAAMSISQSFMHFDNLSIKTPFSTINTDFIRLKFSGFSDFSDFVNKVDLIAIFKSASLSFNDISFFAPALNGYDEQFRLTGLISGQISNLKGENIIISYQNNTQLEASFKMIGLPDIKTTYMIYDIRNFHSNIHDLEMLKIPGRNKTSRLNLPLYMAHLGEINYSGKFTGYIDDFVAYGIFTTDLGKLSTDILLKPDTSKSLTFHGNLKTRDFFIGKLVESEEKLGRISMSANINGFTSKKSIKAQLDGVIDSFELYKYNYKNIQLAGTLTNKNFDGSFKISDPNIAMEFQGKVNFTSEKPVFEFTANVSRARPYYLHIGHSDPDYFVSFLLETNFKGKSIDDINGEIRVVNSLFRKKEKQIQIYNFSLLAETIGGSKSIIIKSDVLDGEIKGNYQFSSLGQSFRNFAYYYIPAFGEDSMKVSLSNDKNKFTYELNFKNIYPVISFFFPDFYLANRTHVFGQYIPKDKIIELNASSPLVGFQGNEWNDLEINSRSTPESLIIATTSKNLIMTNDFALDSFKLMANLSNNTTDIRLNWNSYQKPYNKGQLNFAAIFSKNPSSSNPVVKISIKPSEIVFHDLLWTISKSSITLDSSSYTVDSFKINNNVQNLLVHGKLSSDPNDDLKFIFKDMDLSSLNIFTRKIRLNLIGKVTGIASMQDPFNKPIFLSDLKLDSLNINGEELGKGEILANWNHDEKKIHLKTSAGLGLIPTFNIEGDYYPKNSKLDFKIGLDKLRLNMFDPFANVLISDLKGIATGDLTLEGTLKTPDFNGKLKLMKTSLIVNYLKTRYNFTNDVIIAHNNIIIKNFEFFDEKGNLAVGEGSITNHYFKDFNLDFKIESKNFEFLNTTQKDNQLFYGLVFASGIIQITGPPSNLFMNITARSEKNTVFFIPLSGSNDIRENNFVYWVKDTIIGETVEKAPLKNQTKVKGLKMNLKLEVTPDAEVQLIFDPVIGDKIRGKGSGNLNLLINTIGKFEIFGDITILEGDYLFTLKNLINKKFNVENGGRISWNGNPVDANIDLKAFYNLRTSIYPLVQDPESDPNSESLKKRIPVDCKVSLTGKLMNPTIVPDITLRTADQQSQNYLKNSINTEDGLMQQFMALLLLNEFIPARFNPLGGNTIASSGMTGGTELLSNQLSRWLSQIAKDFDIGLNYRPGDQITTDQMEVALSTQILNDRVLISGNLDVGGNEITPTSTTNTNNIVGDFEIDYKITEKFHVKGFNRSNDNQIFLTSPYTQGAGLLYRESFNNLGELFTRYKEGLKELFTRKKKKTTTVDSAPGISP